MGYNFIKESEAQFQSSNIRLKIRNMIIDLPINSKTK